MTSAINRTSAEELAKKLGIEKPKDAPILFPEVWDVASARMLIEAGYPLLSTSASAYAWAQGYRPGERVKLEELLIMAGRIVRDTKHRGAASSSKADRTVVQRGGTTTDPLRPCTP